MIERQKISKCLKKKIKVIGKRLKDYKENV